MNHHNINPRLSLSMSTLMLALLTACGGGGDSQDNIGGGGSLVGSTDSMALPAAAATDSDEVLQVAGSDSTYQTVAGATDSDEVRQVTGSDSTYQTVAAATVCGAVGPSDSGISRLGFPYGSLTTRIAGHDVPIDRIASLEGYGYNYDGGVQSLQLPMQDLRAVMDRNYTTGLPVGDMGVEMSSQFAAGSVGCINGVSRFNDIKGTETRVDDLHSWISAMLTDLPMGLIPQTPIDGFEYTHNFAQKPAVAVFRIGKDTLANTSNAQICHIDVSRSVNCERPAVTDDGVQWTLKRSISEPGVYVLSAPKS